MKSINFSLTANSNRRSLDQLWQFYDDARVLDAKICVREVDAEWYLALSIHLTAELRDD